MYALSPFSVRSFPGCVAILATILLFAGSDEFRTAPLWGVGQRLFFTHDGRTTDLLKAIRLHSGPATDCISVADSESFKANGTPFSPSSTISFCGSEANIVVARFFALPPGSQQDILNFLRSL